MIVRHRPSFVGLVAYASGFVPVLYAARRRAKADPATARRAIRDSGVGEGGRRPASAPRLHWSRDEDGRLIATWQAYADD